MEYRVIISGFGGQGVLFAGKVLAQAAVYDGVNVSWLPSYDPEMRGGTCNCRIVVSDKEISSPAFSEADALIAMNVPSAERFSPDAASLIVTDAAGGEVCKDGAKVQVVDVVGCDTALINMAMLGAFIAKTGIVSRDSVHAAIRSVAKTGAQEDIDALGI